MKPASEETESSQVEPNIRIAVSTAGAGIRLDHFLVQNLPGYTRSHLAHSVLEGLIRVSGKIKKNSYRLKSGEIIEGTVFVEPETEILPEKMALEILMEDDSLLLLSKPPDLVVHPGSGNSHHTLVNGLVHYCQNIAEVGESERPGIVHRLDKDTSGIMVVAKNSAVHSQLSHAFKEREVKKKYIALVHGIMAEKEGRLVASIGRHRIHRQKMCVRESSGKYAVTNWQVVEELQGKFSLVELLIETGRTHQIRVHMEYLGHPVAGDKVYGGRRATAGFPRQMLHASQLQFLHPVKKQKISYTAPLWDDFSKVLESLREYVE